MLRYIELQGEIFEYELTWKNVKNINLRVRADGSISVSARKSVGVFGVERFIRENESFIFRAMERFSSSEQVIDGDMLCEGAAFPVLGMKRYLHIEKGAFNSASLSGETLTVTARDPSSDDDIKKAIHKMLADFCERLLPSMVMSMTERFAHYGIKYPEIRYRYMVSRWGSCCPASHTVTFNKYLLCAPIECIEYVVAHEFVHFLVLNHSADFYAILSQVMPDWKERKKKLAPYGALIRKI